MSNFERMRIICFFDIPTDTEEMKKEYRKFRKALLENGFDMMQYSVYVRVCPNRTYAAKFIPKLKRMIPSVGNVRTIMVTEKQYSDMEILIGQKSRREEIVGERRIIVI